MVASLSLFFCFFVSHLLVELHKQFMNNFVFSHLGLCCCVLIIIIEISLLEIIGSNEPLNLSLNFYEMTIYAKAFLENLVAMH